MAIGPIQPARFTEWHANPIVRAVGVARRDCGAELHGAVELGDPVRVRLGREVVRAGAGLELDGDTGRRRTPERRVDRHVGADPVALEAERLEQHPGPGVAVSTPGQR